MTGGRGEAFLAPAPKLIGSIDSNALENPRPRVGLLHYRGTSTLPFRLNRDTGGVLGMTSTGTSVIEVETDAGVTGWGDGAWGARVLRDRPEMIIGRSPFEFEAIFDEIAEADLARFQCMPRWMDTLGGLDVALWDVVGRALEKPCWPCSAKSAISLTLRSPDALLSCRRFALDTFGAGDRHLWRSIEWSSTSISFH